MATKVYLNSRNIIVSKDNGEYLSIRQDRAIYYGIMPRLSSDGITPPVMVNVQFTEIYTNTSIIEAIDAVTDQNGNAFSTFQALQVYLNSFFFRSDTIFITKEGATKENQETIIEQNTTIISEAEATELNTRELKKIKDLEKEGNKILKKIYN